MDEASGVVLSWNGLRALVGCDVAVVLNPLSPQCHQDHDGHDDDEIAKGGHRNINQNAKQMTAMEPIANCSEMWYGSRRFLTP